MTPLGATALLFGLLVSHGFEVGVAYTKGGSSGFGASSSGSGFGGTIGFPHAHSSIEFGRSVGSGGSRSSGSSSGIESGGEFGGSSGSGVSGAFGASSGSGLSGGLGGSSGYGSRSFPERLSHFYFGTHTPSLYGIGDSSQGGHGLLGSTEGFWRSSRSERPAVGSRGGYSSASGQWGYGGWGGSRSFGSSTGIGSGPGFGGRTGSGLSGAYGSSSGSGLSGGLGGSSGYGYRSFPESFSHFYFGTHTPLFYGIGESSQGGHGLLGSTEGFWRSSRSGRPAFGSRGGYSSASGQLGYGGWGGSRSFGSNTRIGSGRGFGGRSGSGLSGPFGSSSGSGFSGGFGGSSGSSRISGFGGRWFPGSYLAHFNLGTPNTWVYGVGGSSQGSRAQLDSQDGYGTSSHIGRSAFGQRGDYGSSSRQWGHGTSGGSSSGLGSGVSGLGGQGDFGSSSSGNELRSIYFGSRGFGGEHEGPESLSLYGGRYGSIGSSSPLGSSYSFPNLGQGALVSGLMGGSNLYSNFGSLGSQEGVRPFGIYERFDQRLLWLLSRLRSRLLSRLYLRHLRRRRRGGILIFLRRLAYGPSEGHGDSHGGFGGSYGSGSWGEGSYGYPGFYYFTYGPQAGVGSTGSIRSLAGGFGASNGVLRGSDDGFGGSSGGFSSWPVRGPQKEISQVRY